METYWIKRLDQASLLSDSFKLALMEYFSDEPTTIKEVAALMQVKQTRLYRHIDSLVQAGLLKVVREERKRGTIERYYQTVARRFEIDSALFTPEKGEKSEAVRLIQSVLRDTESEILPLLDDVAPEGSTDDELSALLMRVSIRGSKAQMKALRKKLAEWIEECESLKPDENDKQNVSFRGLVTFYPVSAENDQGS